MNLRTRYKNFLVLFLITPIFLAAMDMPYQQLQLRKSDEKPVFYGKLFIDHLESQLHPSHVYNKDNPVTYLSQDCLKKYRFAKQFENVASNMPFVHVIINPKDSYLQSEIFTIMPVNKLYNCNTGSQIDFEIDKCIFRLICTKNEKLNIKPKYFPQDVVENRENKVKNTFETQFLSCMNWFYAKAYCHIQKNIPKLVQNNILQEHRHEINRNDLLLIAMVTNNPRILTARYLSIYTHGIHGCSTSKHLIDLATKKTTKPYGSTFNFVMNRTTGKPSPKAAQSSPAEAGRLKCYYNYLENVKNVGNKSSMPKTIHAYKSPAIDDINIHQTPIDAEEISQQQAILDNILEDCLVESATQEKTEMATLDTIIENCLTDCAAQETKIPVRNNPRPQLRDGLIGNECVIL